MRGRIGAASRLTMGSVNGAVLKIVEAAETILRESEGAEMERWRKLEAIADGRASLTRAGSRSCKRFRPVGLCETSVFKWSVIGHRTRRDKVDQLLPASPLVEDVGELRALT